MTDLGKIVDALSRNKPKREPPPENVRERASVAIALAGPAEDLHICFMLRATREGDLWSGQMAFPGGRAHVADADPTATAIRETLEEVGLTLTDAQTVGALDDLSMRRRGMPTRGVISPRVFHVGEDLPPLRPDVVEAADAWWVPMRHLWNPAHRTSLVWKTDGARLVFPGIAWRGQTIWGLSYRILRTFADVVGGPLPQIP